MKKTIIRIPLKPIELDSDGVHLLLPISIGSEINNFYFIVDTGASKSVFDDSILTENEYAVIETNSIESSQLTEMISGKIILIHSITIESHNFANFEALSMPLQHINSIYQQFIDKPIAGLIGGDFLSKYKSVISYKKMYLELSVPI